MTWLVLLIVWIACGALTASVARSKRRSVGGWFWLGVLFGPFALLAAAGIGEAGHPCRACRKAIDPRASVCPYCRTDAPIAAPAARAPGREREQLDIRRLALFLAAALLVALVWWAVTAPA